MLINDGQHLPLMNTTNYDWFLNLVEPGPTRPRVDGTGSWMPVNALPLPPEFGGSSISVESTEIIEKSIDPHIGTPITELRYRKWNLHGTDTYMMENLHTGTCTWCRPEGNLK
jgi:hypothetical protein